MHMFVMDFGIFALNCVQIYDLQPIKKYEVIPLNTENPFINIPLIHRIRTKLYEMTILIKYEWFNFHGWNVPSIMYFWCALVFSPKRCSYTYILLHRTKFKCNVIMVQNCLCSNNFVCFFLLRCIICL